MATVMRGLLQLQRRGEAPSVRTSALTQQVRMAKLISLLHHPRSSASVTAARPPGLRPAGRFLHVQIKVTISKYTGQYVSSAPTGAI